MSENNDASGPGRLLQHNNSWSFIFLPEDLDELSFVFQEEWGYEPNGHSWNTVIETLVSTRFPELVPLLKYDSEGDMFYAVCSQPEPLTTITQILRQLLQNPEELREALQKAEPD